MDIDPLLGVPVKEKFNSEIGRFGLIVRVGGMSLLLLFFITLKPRVE